MPPALSERKTNDLRPLSMIILTHPKPSTSPAHAHFPTLVHLSNLQPPSSSPRPTNATRLIPLASSTDARLASKLHIPRVGALAIFADAPGAAALEAFVRQNVDVTACVWIDEAMAVEWRGVNVKAEVGKVSSKMEKNSKTEKKGSKMGEVKSV
jgi:ribonuclease P/MRP protein subunit POP3